MSWATAIGVALVMLVFLFVGLLCIVDVGMTWGDPKGGASGNLPPVLTTAERAVRSIPASIVLMFMFGLIVRWWKCQRTA